MGSDLSQSLNGKPRKRPAPKTAGRPNGSKLKCTMHLSVEASQRLDIHCTMMGMDRSELVESLINQHLRRYVVSDRGGSETEVDSTAA